MNAIRIVQHWKLLVQRLVRDLRDPNRSYAQHQEDLVAEFLLGKVSSYIDIGANDGFTFSNTRRFARQSARGLCFEPVANTYRRLRLFTLPYPRVKCILGGVSDYQGTCMVQEEGYLGLLSSTTRTVAEHVAPLNGVEMNTLSGWLERLKINGSIDLLSIDVEGDEEAVLRGADFVALAPKLVIIETDKVGIGALCAILSPLGYVAVLSNGLNTLWQPSAIVDRDKIQRATQMWPELMEL
jgi:FkbM family methyltransferase